MHAQIPGESSRTYEWQHMTATDFAALDRNACVVMVTCSPLEVHGPHLPVAADNAEGEALSRRTREILSARFPEITFLRMPPLFVAADLVPHPGSVPYRPSTVVRVLSDMGHTLARQGFRHIWVGNFHGGPRHFLAIEEASERTNRRHGTRMISMFSLLAKTFTQGTSNLSKVLSVVPGLDESVLDGDTHGGAIETSLLLHILGDHVHPSWRSLPRMTLDIKRAQRGESAAHARPGRASLPHLIKSFAASLRYFTEETYTGSPARGSAEIGAQVLEILAEHSANTLGEVWRGTIPPSEAHSPIWPLRHLFLNETLQWLIERAVGVRNPIT
jgi:creatinine amidohydrolase/Fe(II)-dependent formamide hydrolase-like protein